MHTLFRPERRIRAKTHLFVLSLISGLLCGMTKPETASAQQGDPVTVMTYNIHHGESASGKLALHAIAEVIKEHNVDIVGLQEVDRHWSKRSQFVDQARQLSEMLEMNVFFSPIYDLPAKRNGKPRRQFGLAILSKFPLAETRNFHLTRKTIKNPPGGFPMVTVKVGKSLLHVFNTHLDYRKDPALRQIEVDETMDIIKNVQGPKVLMGDFNARPESPELKPLWPIFNDAWNIQGEGSGYTYPSETPTKRIDYVMLTPEIKVESIKVLSTQASDHRPIVATIRLPLATQKSKKNKDK